MSVSEEFTLPGQPSGVGGFTFRPLGGDGFTSPQAAYQLDQIEVSGDASGGNAEIHIHMDQHYQSLVSQIYAYAETATSAREVKFQVIAGTFSANVVSPGIYGAQDDNSRAAWMPPPIFDCDRIKLRWPNVLGINYQVSGMIYLFNRSASHRTPLSVLLASVPQAGSLIG